MYDNVPQYSVHESLQNEKKIGNWSKFNLQSQKVMVISPQIVVYLRNLQFLV